MILQSPRGPVRGFPIGWLAMAWFVTGAFTAFANDAGGGTNGVGADVTLTDNGSTVTLANGIISAVIDKNSADLNSLKFLGTETVLSGGGNVYYSMDGQPIYRTMSGCAYAIKTNSADRVDVLVPPDVEQPGAGVRHRGALGSAARRFRFVCVCDPGSPGELSGHQRR